MLYSTGNHQISRACPPNICMFGNRTQQHRARHMVAGDGGGRRQRAQGGSAPAIRWRRGQPTTLAPSDTTANSRHQRDLSYFFIYLICKSRRRLNRSTYLTVHFYLPYQWALEQWTSTVLLLRHPFSWVEDARGVCNDLSRFCRLCLKETWVYVSMYES